MLAKVTDHLANRSEGVISPPLPESTRPCTRSGATVAKGSKGNGQGMRASEVVSTSSLKRHKLVPRHHGTGGHGRARGVPREARGSR